MPSKELNVYGQVVFEDIMSFNRETQYYSRGLDILKFCLSFFIVASHCRLAEEVPLLKEVLDTLFSTAIPLFFAISTFLFTKRICDAGDNQRTGILKHSLLRLAILFCVWYLLSFPVTLNRWWRVATLKETVYALFFGCTAWGYWFIKALGINLSLIFLCRNRGAFITLFLLSVIVYLFFAFNYVFDFYEYPYHPYYSFYYHTAYCCLGAWLARNPRILSALELRCKLLLMGWLLVFVVSLFAPIGPVFRVLSITLLFPSFSRLTNGNSMKHLRYMSTIIYMSQFIIIFYYDILFVGDTAFLACSPIRFLLVITCCLAFAFFCVTFEKRIPALQYLR